MSEEKPNAPRCNNSQRFGPALIIVQRMGVKCEDKPRIAEFDNEIVSVQWGHVLYHITFGEGRDWLDITGFSGKLLSQPDQPPETP